LPEEFGKGKRFARLRRWLYGMRKAAQCWEDHYTQKLLLVCFLQGKSAPTVFFNPDTYVKIVVHGDDFTCSGNRKELETLKANMESWYAVKFRGMMGSGRTDIKEIVILGRTLRWFEDRLELEADEKHRKMLIKECGLEENSKSVVSLMVREDRKMEGGVV
jgi:hypothetical protein